MPSSTLASSSVPIIVLRMENRAAQPGQGSRLAQQGKKQAHSEGQSRGLLGMAAAPRKGQNNEGGVGGNS